MEKAAVVDDGPASENATVADFGSAAAGNLLAAQVGPFAVAHSVEHTTTALLGNQVYWVMPHTTRTNGG